MKHMSDSVKQPKYVSMHLSTLVVYGLITGGAGFYFASQGATTVVPASATTTQVETTPGK